MKMRLFFIIMVFFSSTLYAQQLIVSGTYINQYNVFEKQFQGRVQTISKFSYKGSKFFEYDTINYVSDKNGLFSTDDTSKINLEDMFEGFHYKYDKRSKIFKDNAGRSSRVIDSAYRFEGDNYTDTVVFYPQFKFFIHKVRKNLDSACGYMTLLFDGGQRLKKKAYYLGHKNIPYNYLLSYLGKTKFSELYEISYEKINSTTKITKINFYSTDRMGKKHLKASNIYFYGINKLVNKISYLEFKRKGTFMGEIRFNYFPRA